MEMMKMAKSKYKEWLEPQNLLRIQGWAMDGLTEAQICHNMGISTVTLWEWKKKYPNISNVLKVNKDIADRQVENALFKAAKDGNITAQIFWLKNRKRKEWRDKQELEHNGKIDSNINFIPVKKG
jgi:hypothetical protein